MTWTTPKSVLVPVDFSDSSFAAVDVALEIAEDPSHVHVLHVLAPLTAMEPGALWHTVDDASRIQHVQDALRERLEAARYERVSIEAVVGNPGSEIADFARSIGADLIVMPSHGRTGLERMLIGSVAERVVRLAPCPVLVLRK